MWNNLSFLRFRLLSGFIHFTGLFLFTVKYHQIDTNQKDGAEGFLKIFIVISVATSIISSPAVAFAIHNELHAAALIKTPYLVITILSTLPIPIFVLVDWIYVFHNVAIALIYCNSVNRWLQFSRLEILFICTCTCTMI